MMYYFLRVAEVCFQIFKFCEGGSLIFIVI